MRKFLVALFALFCVPVYASSRTVASYGPTGTVGASSVIPAAGTVIITDPFIALGDQEIDYISMSVFFDVTTAGGTTINAYLQTSMDFGTTWWDTCDLQILAADVMKGCSVSKYVAAAVRTAAVDGSLANDTIFNGFFGTKWRVKLVIVGAYNADNIYRLHVDWQKVR